MKRSVFLWHRYLGIGLSLLFAFWFVSGVAMLYVRMPILEPPDRFALLPRIDPDHFEIAPHEAFTRAGLDGAPRRMRMGLLLDRPVYYFLPQGERWVGVFADDGTRLHGVSSEEGAAVVRRFAPPGVEPQYLETVRTIDQWTLTNSLNLHRPLHRYALGDEDGTEMYVSQVTGEIVMRSTRLERALAWIGPILHWVAPEVLRTQVAAWRQALIWLSAAGTLLILTGLFVGISRYRRRGYVMKGGGEARRTWSPYFGLKLQHHWSGLLFGAVTLTWIFSGLLYMNPGGRYQGDLSTTTQVTPYSVGGIRGSQAPRPGQPEAFRGGPLEPALWQVPPALAWRNAGVSPLPKDVELVRFAGRPYYVFYTDVFESMTVAADDPSARPLARHGMDAIVERATMAVTDGRPVEAELLDSYDAYYYSVGAVAPKRLPVVRLRFDDPTATLMYVDPHTGTIFRTYDRQARVMRWLVVGLHCLDFPFLMFNRPAWDLAIIGLSLGGLLLSVSGTVIGWRRLRPRRSGARNAQPLSTRLGRALPLAVAAIVLGHPGIARAQDQEPPPADAATQVPTHLETVVVTATRQEERTGDLPVTVQTFDTEEIRQSTAATVTEFLSERGVAFFSAWTPAQTQVNIRGGASDAQGRDFRSQVVVLVNGRRAGTANLSKLSLHDMRRIEVLRGPGSLGYGNQALGGVINLITKDGLRDAGPFLSVQTGSWGLFSGVAQYGGSTGRWDYFLSVHAGRRGDYDAGGDAVESPQRNTGYEQRGGLAALGFTPDAFNRLTFTFRSDGMYDAGFRGSSWDWDNREDRANQSADVLYTGQLGSGRASWNLQGSFFRDVDDFRWGSEVVRLGSGLPGPGVDEDNVTRRQRGAILRALGSVQASTANTVQFGADTEWTWLRNTRTRVALPGSSTTQIAPFDNDSDSRNLGVFAEDAYRLFGDSLILRGGLRYDRGRHQVLETPNVPLLREREESYDAVTYRVGATAKPSRHAALRVSLGTGYRAPTATELAVDFTTVLGNQVVGNPDLEPERTTSVEVGAALEWPRAWVDVALFRNDITDRIATVPVAPGSSRSMYQNRNESDVAGVEVQSRVELADLTEAARLWAGVTGVYNFRMRDLDAAARGLNTDRIERMYESQATLSLGVTDEAWGAQLSGTYYGRIWYDTEENLLVPQAEPVRTFIHEKSPYWLWSLRGRRALTRGVWITAAVDNLFDANEHPLFIALNREPLLADVRFSNGGVGNSLPGRAFIVGLEFRP